MATYADLLTEVRDLIQDSDTNAVYRFSDTLLIRKLNRALKDMSRIRPDAFYGLYDANSLNVPEISDADPTPEGKTALTATFQFEGQFWTPIVAYVVGSTELIEDEYTVDQRAAALLSQFRNALVSI